MTVSLETVFFKEVKKELWTDIYLINSSQQDINYNHTPYFSSLTSQLNWYASKRVYTIEQANYQRKNNNLKVNYHIDELSLVNYAMVNNSDKWYFYFVVDKVYINERTTELILRLDVIQTYLFDFSLGNCLIERTHTNRYDSNGNVILEPMFIEEDFSSGEYTPFTVKEIFNYKNKGSYIITSSDLLGTLNPGDYLGSSSGSGGSGGNSGSGDSTNNTISPTGIATNNITEGLFVFNKAKEGFSSTPYALGDGFYTIGYGVTSQKSEYNTLAPSCTEEQASNVMYDLLLNDYYMPVYNLIKGKRNNPRQCEVEAFADLCYNGGLGAVTSSPMYERYIANDTLANCVVGWEDWYIRDGNGTVYQGLIKRRQQEVQMFLNADYPKEAIAILGGGTVTSNNGKGYIPPEIGSSSSSSGGSGTSSYQYLNLHGHMSQWAVYNVNPPYTLAYAIGYLLPSNWGGLSYKIYSSKGGDVYEINTDSYGRCCIYAPRDNDSSITSKPLYIYGDVDDSSPGAGEPGSGDIRQSIVNSALKLIGKPYRYGGNYPPLDSIYGGTSDGTDCSGLCQWAYNDAGATNLTSMSGRWTTYTMYPNSTKISLSNAQPGDVIFTLFNSNGLPEHVYMIKSVSGNTIRIIEAQQPGVNILERNVTYNNSMVIGRLIK